MDEIPGTKLLTLRKTDQAKRNESTVILISKRRAMELIGRKKATPLKKAAILSNIPSGIVKSRPGRASRRLKTTLKQKPIIVIMILSIKSPLYIFSIP